MGIFSDCANCKKTLKKGDLYVLMGEYPGFIQKSFFGSLGGLGQLGNCILLCDKCFKKKFQERK